MTNRPVPLISAIEASRVYRLSGEEIHAVRQASLDILPGRFIALVGRSGSGKTTLLNLLAGLDRPTSGQVLFEGRDLARFGERDLVELRRHRLGFVFQSFGLLPLLSAYENVELPLRIAGVDAKARSSRTSEVLEMVGLLRRARHRPYELSGGEQQRVAIARAVALKPPVILADEPTGELDSTNAHAIFSLFQEMVHRDRLAIVATTHDQTLLDLADEVHEMHDGSIRSLRTLASDSPDEMFKPPASRKTVDATKPVGTVRS
ncbi:MAG: ABC transporter ATP-binding protein [Chloroflexi bacterium]|nr:ABC transporter ATP-binding protein [Chloroflexota bacterium]